MRKMKIYPIAERITLSRKYSFNNIIALIGLLLGFLTISFPVINTLVYEEDYFNVMIIYTSISCFMCILLIIFTLAHKRRVNHAYYYVLGIREDGMLVYFDLDYSKKYYDPEEFISVSSKYEKQAVITPNTRSLIEYNYGNIVIKMLRKRKVKFEYIHEPDDVKQFLEQLIIFLNTQNNDRRFIDEHFARYYDPDTEDDEILYDFY